MRRREGALSRMRKRTAAADHLVSRYRLHEGDVPVMIRQVANDEGWVIAFAPLDDLHGYAVVKGAIKVMTINCLLPREYQRMTIAHEMAHYLNGDAGMMWTSRIRSGEFSDWVFNQMERAATLTAARILIPLDQMGIGAEPYEVAVRCSVPVELVELYADHIRSTL